MKKKKLAPKSKPVITYIVIFKDGGKKRMSCEEVNTFIKKDKRMYSVRNSNGEAIMTKTFKG